MIHIDTHVAMWIYLEQLHRLTPLAKRVIEAEEVKISPMVELELAYLHEIGRLIRSPADVLTALTVAIGVTRTTVSFSSIVAHAMDITWTRDTFDRLIVATALADGSQLITSDRVIRANCSAAVWD